MALYINMEKNSLVFNDIDYEKNYNYTPLIAGALNKLDPHQTINFAIDLDETPIIFMLYIDKIKRAVPDIDIKVYHKEDSPLLRENIEKENTYYNIDEFPQ